MTQRLRIGFFLLASLAFAVITPVSAHAQVAATMTVSPVVIDEKAKARDILKETITLTNTSQRKIMLYPSVNNVKPKDGQEAFVSAQDATDRQDSLANWIEISRGVIELSPGETREVPFVIRVSLNALPDTYHADISFYEGSAREGAETQNPLSVVTVNTEVQADIKESMQLNKFMTDGFFFSGDDVLFNYQVENIGNQELKPKGEIRIYDRKGREVASIPVNAEGKSLTPEQKAQLASAWSSAQGFGKFKAFLNIDYGNNQNGTLQDTVFFWIIPWQQLLALLTVSIIAIIISALYFHRWLEHKHMQRFASMHGGAAALSAPPGMITPVNAAPIAAIMPAPVTEEKADKPTKSGFFSRFRFFKKKASQEAAAPVSVAASPVVPEQPTPARVPAPEPVRAPIPAARTSAQRTQATIDLTATQMTAPTPRTEGHVINLKNGS
jgi:hypothetical protein